MRSNRTIQTILQALLVVLLAALVFRKPPPQRPAADAAAATVQPPSHAALTQAYKMFFGEHEEARRRAELISVTVRAVSAEDTEARARLRVYFKWLDHNPGFTTGPLKNAPGRKGDRVEYTETFLYRRWDTGWDIEGRVEPADIR